MLGVFKGQQMCFVSAMISGDEYYSSGTNYVWDPELEAYVDMADSENSPAMPETVYYLGTGAFDFEVSDDTFALIEDDYDV